MHHFPASFLTNTGFTQLWATSLSQARKNWLFAIILNPFDADPNEANATGAGTAMNATIPNESPNCHRHPYGTGI